MAARFAETQSLTAIQQELLAFKAQGRLWVYESTLGVYLQLNNKRNLGVIGW